MSRQETSEDNCYYRRRLNSRGYSIRDSMTLQKSVTHAKPHVESLIVNLLWHSIICTLEQPLIDCTINRQYVIELPKIREKRVVQNVKYQSNLMPTG